MRFLPLILVLFLITSGFSESLKKAEFIVKAGYRSASDFLLKNLSVRDFKKIVRLKILYENELPENSFSQYGFKIINKNKGYALIEGPFELIPLLKNVKNIKYVQRLVPITPLLDKARTSMKADSVHDFLSTSLEIDIKGEGVIVAVLDTEFDIDHPAFLDEKGESRFIGIWDFYPEDDENLPSFAYNTERVPYGAALIGEELEQHINIGEGNSTHGTHVASIAAGSETGNNLRGIAPKAQLIGIKVYQDSDEIIDTFGNPFYQQYTAYNGELAHGISWAFKLADSLELPCVVNLSIGSSMGPHDGTSLFDRFIDSVSGAGRVIVGSAGNSGDKKIHLKFDLNPNDTSGSWGDPLSFKKDEKDNEGKYLLVDFWGEVGTNFSVQALIKNRETEKNIKSSFVSSAVTGDWLPDTAFWNDDTIIFYFETDSQVILNGKSRIIMGIVSSDSNVDLGFRITGDGTVNGWHSNMYRGFHSYNTDGFVDGDTLNSIIEIGGTANSSISVAAYVTRGEGENWEGTQFNWLNSLYGEEEEGIAYWSSVGPTIDGRQKPDVAAPGKMIAAAQAEAFTGGEDITSHWPSYPDKEGRYIYLRGTSMSAPMVTGAVALMLQVNPALDYSDIKKIFEKTSTADNFTGAVPNYRWGSGKINLLKAVEMASEMAIPITTVSYSFPKLVSLKQSGEQLIFDMEESIGRCSIELFDFRGRIISKKIKTADRKKVIINLSDIAKQPYFVKIQKGKKSILQTKILLY